jgi:hypothetical protein
MRFAYINNGMVFDSIEVRPETVFYPAYASLFIEVPDEVRSGWFYDGTTFSPPPEPEPIPEPAAPTKEQLMAELAALTAKIQALA